MRAQKMHQEVDLLITRGKILTLDDHESIFDSGDIAIRGDTILDIGSNLPERYHGRQIIDASGQLVMPGLINAHTHAAMTLLRGLADDLALRDWLQDHIFPVEARYMTPENVYLGTLLACIEMIKSGTTTLCDGYFFESEAAQAVYDAGLRGVMAQGIIDFPCADAKSPQEGWQRSEEFIRRWRNSDKIMPALFCHSAYTCSPDTLRRAKDLAQNYAIPLFLHLAETRQEVEYIEHQYGKRPVGHVADLGILDEGTVAVHCVWLNSEEIDLLHRLKVRVVHVPESNMKLASGIAPVPALLQKGVPVGLGTDGSASNNDLDLFLEMDSAAKLHKVALQDPTAMKAEAVVHMATREGARVIGMDQEIGTLAAGKKADIILLDLKKPHLLPLYNVYSHLVYTFNGADVCSVISSGKMLMKDRRLLYLDENDILERVEKLATQIQNG
jgi:5-methylthioadenosine/S-adenosylhomocysteine deaminase